MCKRTNINPIVLLFLLLHILFLLLVILYASRTSFVGEIELYSDDNFQIIAETPVGTTIDFQTDSFDTITISERTFRCIELRTQDDKSVLIDEDFPNDTVYTFSSTKIHFQSTPYVKSKLSGVFLFIITNTPALKLYLSLILLGVLFFLFQFLFLKKKRSLYKIRYFRFLLKRKSAKREIKKPVLNRIQFILVVVGLIAIIPASYLRLGQYPFSQGSEERRRALVSLEMKIQHEYLKPTVCGEPYFNKPPLFNWFLIPFVDKDNVEFNTRAISVSFLLLAACIVIALLKKSRGLRHALLVSFMFLSSTYIVTEFSMILNLDTFFALLLIPLFYLNFRLANKGKFYAMFIIGYFLTSLAFMTKGFPALWFQGVSVILALYFTKNLRKLISFQHLCGILSFLILPLLYFTLQAELIDSKLYINQLIKETLIANNFSFSDIVLHFFAFPFLNILAYLPMAILLPALLLRRNIILILKNKEISYLLFMCFIGCSVFAISPYYPRYYCLMFVPLLFDVIIFLLPQMHNLKIKEKTGAIVWIIVFSIFALPLFRFDNIEIILIIIAVSVLIWATNKIRLYIIIIASLVLITVKLTYPLHELKNEKFGYETKEQCREIVSSNKDTELYIQKGSKKINYVSIFYLTYFSGEVVHYSQPEINPDALYITDFENLPDNATVLDTIEQTFWEYDENKRLKGDNSYSPIFVIRYD